MVGVGGRGVAVDSKFLSVYKYIADVSHSPRHRESSELDALVSPVPAKSLAETLYG